MFSNPGLINSSLLWKAAVAKFVTMSTFYHTMDNSFNSMFDNGTYASGNSVQLRLDNFTELNRGYGFNAQPIVAAAQSLTLQELYGAHFVVYESDHRKIVNFESELVEPAMRTIVKGMNSQIYRDASLTVADYCGDPTTPLNSYNAINQANTEFTLLNIDHQERYMVMDPSNRQQLMNAPGLYNSFEPVINKEIAVNAQIKHIAGFDLFSDTSVQPFITGTHTAAGDITVKTAVQTGNTIVVTGLTPTTGTFKPGDRFQLGEAGGATNIYKWDNIQNVPVLNRYLQFVVTQVNGSSDPAGAGADANGDLTLTVIPSGPDGTLTNTGPRQNYLNAAGVVPNQIPAGTIVYPVTNSTTGYIQNYAYTRKSIAYAMPMLHAPIAGAAVTMKRDPKYNVAITVWQQADADTYGTKVRFDTLPGWTWVYGQSVAVLSSVA